MRVRSAGLALAVICSSLAFALPAAAQIESNLGAYTENNAKGYMEPLKNALGVGLANALYTTAHIPTEGFTFRLSGQVTFVRFSDDDKTFMATPEAYYPGDATPQRVPTVVGRENPVVITDPDSGAQFVFPGGLDLDDIGLAVPTLSVGGVRGTEVMVRWLSTEVGDAEIGDLSLFGAGARHSIYQYLENFPVDLSGMILFQSLNLGDDFVDSSQFTIGVQASKRWSVVEPYLGLALDSYHFEMKYQQNDGLNTQDVAVDYDTDRNLHLTVGAALNLGPLHLNGEANLSEQFSYAFGFALGM